MEEQGLILAQHGPDKAGVLTSAGLTWGYSEVLIFETTWTMTSASLRKWVSTSQSILKFYNPPDQEVSSFRSSSHLICMDSVQWTNHDPQWMWEVRRRVFTYKWERLMSLATVQAGPSVSCSLEASMNLRSSFLSRNIICALFITYSTPKTEGRNLIL